MIAEKCPKCGKYYVEGVYPCDCEVELPSLIAIITIAVCTALLCAFFLIAYAIHPDL